MCRVRMWHCWLFLVEGGAHIWLCPLLSCVAGILNYSSPLLLSPSHPCTTTIIATTVLHRLGYSHPCNCDFSNDYPTATCTSAITTPTTLTSNIALHLSTLRSSQNSSLAMNSSDPARGLVEHQIPG